MNPELPLVLHNSRWFGLGVAGFFAAVAFAVTDAGVHGFADWCALFGCAFFVLIGIAGFVGRPRLEVTETDITDVSLLSRRTFDLRECGRFHARMYRYRGVRWVITFDYGGVRPKTNHGRTNARRRRPNSRIEVCGRMNGDKLAALLNRLRDHARRT